MFFGNTQMSINTLDKEARSICICKSAHQSAGTNMLIAFLKGGGLKRKKKAAFTNQFCPTVAKMFFLKITAAV